MATQLRFTINLSQVNLCYFYGFKKLVLKKIKTYFVIFNIIYKFFIFDLKIKTTRRVLEFIYKSGETDWTMDNIEYWNLLQVPTRHFTYIC